MHFFNAQHGQLDLHLPQELIVDNFAGGGGASTGLEMALGRPVDIAINHDEVAIKTHLENHPDTVHYCESVWDINPIEVCKGRPVSIAWFSPDCKHFSKAKGGKPVDKNIRGLAWVAVRWAATVRPKMIMLENVEEFKTWGPLDQSNQPCKANQGKTFDSFVKVLRTGLKPNATLTTMPGLTTNHSYWREAVVALGIEHDQKQKLKLSKGLGYQVEWKELKAFEFGVPTTRKRFFLIARCDGNPICWPTPTHGDPKSLEVQSGILKPWKTAADIIDWSLPCPSIFTRKRPLAENTLKRIAKGLERFVIESDKPFFVPSFITEHANASNQRNMPIDEPLRTICAQVKGGHFGLVTAFLAKHYGGNYTGSGISMESPTDTVTTVDHHALVVASMTKFRSGSVGYEVDSPVHTITAGGEQKRPGTANTQGIVTTHLIKLRNNNYGSPVTDPVPTITAGGNRIGEVRAFLVKYYGTGEGCAIDEPLHTVTTKDRFGLVTIHGEDYQIVDIGMRMLSPRELYRAQGFPDSYIIDQLSDGTKLSKAAQVRMCGNSVCPELAAALVKVNIATQQIAKRAKVA